MRGSAPDHGKPGGVMQYYFWLTKVVHARQKSMEHIKGVMKEGISSPRRRSSFLVKLFPCLHGQPHSDLVSYCCEIDMISQLAYGPELSSESGYGIQPLFVCMG